MKRNRKADKKMPAQAVRTLEANELAEVSGGIIYAYVPRTLVYTTSATCYGSCTAG